MNNDRVGAILEGIYEGIPNKNELETMDLDQFLGKLSKTLINVGTGINSLSSDLRKQSEEKPFTITIMPDTNPNNKKIHVIQVDKEKNKVSDKYYSREEFKAICKNSYESSNAQRKQLAYKYGVFVSSGYYSDEFEESYLESGYEDWHDFCDDWIIKQHEKNNMILVSNFPKPLYILKDDAFDNDWTIGEDDENDGRNAILKCIFDLEKELEEIETKYDDLSFQIGQVFHAVKDSMILANGDELYESGIKLSNLEY